MKDREPTACDERVRLAHGPRAVETLLERDVRAEMARVRAEPRLLARPIVLIVPSGSLRDHVVIKLLEWSDGACAGFEVMTIRRAAREILLRAGVSPRTGATLFERAVQDAIARDPLLARVLSAFDQGARACVATLTDFFDAGFDVELAPAATEAAQHAALQGRATRAESERAVALVRVAALVARDMESKGLAHASATFRRAAAFVSDGSANLGARALWIHGFTDATGAVTDLIAEFLRTDDFHFYADSCADSAFGAGLRARVGFDPRGTPRSPAAACSLSRASGIDAEVRAAAVEIRSALARGVAAESIAIVARDLAPYRGVLRGHLRRLAIPFSGHGASGLDGPAERRAKALAVLIDQGETCPLDRWLDARAPHSLARGDTSPFEMRIALRTLGVASLGELARLDLARRLGKRAALVLPIRALVPDDTRAAEEPDDDEIEALDDAPDESAPVARRRERRSVAGERLAAEIELARSTLESFTSGLERAALSTHAAHLHATVARELSWRADDLAFLRLDSALNRLSEDVPPGLALTRDEFHALARAALVESAAPSLGGAGAGVAILDVTEARARTFEELFVLGLARGRFPRVVREDPLLSDALRREIASVLPDLGAKSTGRDEERVLFEQLVHASPRAHLSWVTLDPEEKALLPSPLLERVATPRAVLDTPLLEDVFPRFGAPSSYARPAHEWAVLAGLRGGQSALARVMPVAIESVRASAALETSSSGDIALGRARVLRELEPAHAQRATLGPYFGFVGLLDSSADPRPNPIFVTHLEGVAACGWKTLLSRVLGLEEPPDPLASLPALDPRMIGDVVHNVLAEIVDRSRNARVRWPPASELEALTERVAVELLRDDGILLAGFEKLVVARARPMIDVARALDVAEATRILSTTGAEKNGAIPLPDGMLGARQLFFRVDRVDAITGGRLLTDYKTGAPLSTGARAGTRALHHRKEIGRGRKLQAVVYALAAGTGGVGRYAHLRADTGHGQRLFEIETSDKLSVAAFDEALHTILTAWDLGAFFPRLVDGAGFEPNPACARCEMAPACLRGDSGAHRRLSAFLQSADDGTRDDSSAVRALWALSSKAPEHDPKPEVDPAPRKKRKGDA